MAYFYAILLTSELQEGYWRSEGTLRNVLRIVWAHYEDVTSSVWLQKTIHVGTAEFLAGRVNNPSVYRMGCYAGYLNPALRCIFLSAHERWREWWRLQIMKLLIMQFTPASCYFLSLGSISASSLQDRVPKHLQSYSSVGMSDRNASKHSLKFPILF
jgi:hypothetical protein